MKIIDIHTHIFPDVLASAAIKFLEEEANTKAFHNGTAAGLKKSMKEAGITLSVQHPVATKPSQVKSINDWVKDYQNNSEGILSFGGMHPLYRDFQEEMKRMKGMGFKGYKLHPEYQKFYPDDPSVFPMYEATIENDFIILFHTGEDIGIKPPYYSTPDRMKKLLKIFPKLRMIYAHMGGWMLWDDVEKYLIGEEVYLETSYTMGLIRDSKFTNMVRNHGIDRVLFGTDSPWRSQKDEVSKLLSLPFKDEEKERICYLNSKHLLDLR